MSANPNQRPTANELYYIFNFWYCSIEDEVYEDHQAEKFGYKGKEIKAMFEEADKEIPNISLSYEKVPGAIYTSRVFTFKILSKPINSSIITSTYLNDKEIEIESSANFIDLSISTPPTPGTMLSNTYVKNLLIVGHIGVGKSTLANMLSDTYDFKESKEPVSNTRNFQKKYFEWKGTKYCVIDTRIARKEVLYKMPEIINLMPEGIIRVLFVIDRKFTTEEIEIFELFKKAISKSGNINYTITIVRTKFHNFKDKHKCKKDKEDLCKENEAISKIVESCKSIIYVDIPPKNIRDDLKRDQLRNMLLGHLEKIHQNKLGTWNKIIKQAKRLVSPSLNFNERITPERNKIGNLLIIGRTGSGKSTLANVLSNTYDLEENEDLGSNTRDFWKKNFEWKGMRFCVIDVRVDLTKKKILYNKIGEVIYSIPEGISQVLFVVDKRFTSEELETFKVFGKAILESGIVKYTTIVRTKFVNFENKYECEKDKKELCKENEIIAKIVELCRGVIYVDNLPINIHNGGDQKAIRINRKRREKSRAILLNYLKSACREYYKLKVWDRLHAKITSYMKETESVKSTSKIISNIENNVAKEVERNLNLEVPTLFKINFDAYCAYQNTLEILKNITSSDIEENNEGNKY
ncbi:hypothetical protein C1645_768277 [Glomus cerebriforme]|uniref:AIG1-type G domain-containing protein n=1 Tax=Glomus cerebriforme TaxID=658196 RepID=A0A397T1E1_9GLOM|nr:hypothetical protein C1645_768277 [Glomus cerebriforme]